MTRRRRPERVDLSELSFGDLVTHIINGVKDSASIPRLAAELEAFEAADPLEALCVEAAACRVADEHGVMAGFEELVALRFPHGRVCRCAKCIERERRDRLANGVGAVGGGAASPSGGLQDTAQVARNPRIAQAADFRGPA